MQTHTEDTVTTEAEVQPTKRESGAQKKNRLRVVGQKPPQAKDAPAARGKVRKA